MKAVYYDQPGSPDVLKVVDSEIPVPNDNQILIKVMAAGLIDQTLFKDKETTLHRKITHQS